MQPLSNEPPSHRQLFDRSNPDVSVEGREPITVSFFAKMASGRGVESPVHGFQWYDGKNSSLNVICKKKITLHFQHQSSIRFSYRTHPLLEIKAVNSIDPKDTRLKVSLVTEKVSDVANRVIDLTIDVFTIEKEYLGCLNCKLIPFRPEFPSTYRDKKEVSRELVGSVVNSYFPLVSEIKSEIKFPIKFHTELDVPLTSALVVGDGVKEIPNTFYSVRCFQSLMRRIRHIS